MNRVFIIDDEPLIRRALKRLLERNETSLTIVGEAGNGVEALQKLEHMDVDILFLDIRMPQMDGFELLHRLSATEKAVKTIILTAYRDFDYAAKAIEYGAFGYLVKPIDERKLLEMITKVSDKIEQERRDEHAWEQLLNMQRSRYWSMLLQDGQRDMPELERMIWHEQIEESPYRLIIVQSAPGSAVQPSDFECFYPIMHHKELVLFQKTSDFQATPPWLDSAERYGGAHRYGVSLPFTGRRHVRLAYNQAKTALFLQHSSDTTNVYSYRAPRNERAGKNDTPPLIDPKETDQLTEWLELGLIEEARALTHRFMNKLLEGDVLEMNSVYHAYFQWMKAIRRASSRLQTTVGNRARLHEMTLDDVMTIPSAEMMMTLLNKWIDAWEKDPNYNDSERIVQKIQIFIQSHYEQDISLQSLADDLYLSKNYVSAVFKQKTGTNYHDYLTNVRMERSKERLRTTEKSIGQIAMEVGYKNTSHFCKVFKQDVGISPSEYRQRKYVSP